MADTKDTTRREEAKESWYQAAAGTAIVAGCFSLFVLAVMVTSYVRSLRVDPGNSKPMEALKAALSQDTGNEDLKVQIRTLDLRLRRAYLGATRLLNRGAWLLLGGLVVFVAALKVLVVLRRKLPMPLAVLAEPGGAVRAAIHARRAIAAIAGLLAGAAAVLAISSGAGLTREPPKAIEEASYPSVEELRKNWPRFRGPDGTGVAYATRVPSSWNGKTGQGILWKTQVPLYAPNSPVVWGDKLFLSGATKQKRQVYCFDAGSGQLLWQKPVEGILGSDPDPPEVMEGTGFAASTMATDGERAFAMFANGDVACFDFSGKRVWARNLGKPQNSYGHATSLALWHNLLLIQYDQAQVEDGKSKLLAVSTRSGKTVWQAARRPVPSSWATPIAIQTPQGDQIITAANPWVIAYEAAKGTELWRAKCLAGDVTPSPTFAGGLVFAGQSGSKLAAIRPDGSGDVTATHVLWGAEDGLPDIVSPLANGDSVLVLTSEGLLTCYDAKKGEKVWEHEYDMPFSSSPSLVGDRIYLTANKGITFIIAAGRQYKELGKNELGEEVLASPAILEGRIYMRGKRHLFCIGEKGHTDAK